MKKALPLVLLTSLLLLFLAFRKEEVSIVVSGKVIHKEKGLESVRVVVIKQDCKDLSCLSNLKEVYHEPTSEEGNFRLQFNVLEGSPAFIYFVKPGYSVYKESVFSSGKNKKIQLKKKQLIDLSEEGNPLAKAMYKLHSGGKAVKINNASPARGIDLHLFERPDFESLHQKVSSGSLSFFTKIKPGEKDVFPADKRQDGKAQAITGNWFEVSFLSRNGEIFTGWIFQ